MPQKSLSPEKQLLNLIENPKNKAPLRAATVKYRGLSFFSLSALMGRFSFFKGRFSRPKAGHPLVITDILLWNNALKLCVSGLGIYLIYMLTVSSMNLRKPLDLGFSMESLTTVSPGQIVSPLKAGAFYLEKVRSRDIFKMGDRPSSSVAADGPSDTVVEATAHLRLVGISWADDPDVMIEDTKRNKTLFLKKGQTIDGDIRLELVFKDKVILSYKGEQIILR